MPGKPAGRESFAAGKKAYQLFHQRIFSKARSARRERGQRRSTHHTENVPEARLIIVPYALEGPDNPMQLKPDDATSEVTARKKELHSVAVV